MFDEQVTPEEQKPSDQVDQEPSNDQNANDQEQNESWFEVDGRKYNPDTASKKITHQDQHIGKLEQELAELREQTSKLDKIDKLEELLNQQAQPQQPAPEQPTQNEQTNSFNEEEVESRLLTKMQERLEAQEQAKVAEQNMRQATERAKQLYGTDYAAKLEQTGEELGMSRDDIKNMAAKSPGVFDRLFLAQKGSNPKPTPQNNYAAPRPSSEGTDMYKDAAKSLLDRKAPAKDRTDMIAALLKSAQN